MGPAPVKEGEEAAADVGPVLGLHPTWVKETVFVPMVDVVSVDVKVNGRYRPVTI